MRSVLIALALLAAGAAEAQSYGQLGDVQTTAPGYFFFARPGEPVVAVTAVGAVTATGRYVVRQGTTVADLLALAGGAGVDRSGRATVRVYRDDALLLEREVQALYAPGAAPTALQEGDVVEVVGLVSSVPGYYVHTEPGNDPVAVTAAGAFAAPGRYVVDPGTTVGDLAALAGGVGVLGAREARTEVDATVRLLRDGQLVFESPLEELYARETLPLEAGDVVDLQVTFQQNEPFWRDALAVLTAALGVAVLVERIATN
jgi:protein involved in polysaccharide export with SLBB domain